MRSRLIYIAATTCLAVSFAVMLLHTPSTPKGPQPAAENDQAIVAGARFSELLIIRGERELTPSEEWELRMLRVDLKQQVREHGRRQEQQVRWQ